MSHTHSLECEQLTAHILHAAITVHKELGPGLLESTYESCLVHELMNAGISFRRQIDLPVVYKGHNVDCGYRVDLIVEGAVLLELKSVDRLAPIHEAQLLTYLRLTRLPVGLLLNFNVTRLKDGIVRRANTRSTAAPDPHPRCITQPTPD